MPLPVWVPWAAVWVGPIRCSCSKVPPSAQLPAHQLIHHRLCNYRVRLPEAASRQPAAHPLYNRISKAWLRALLWPLVFQNSHQPSHLRKERPRCSALTALPPPRSHLPQPAGRAGRWMAGGSESGRESPKGHCHVLGLQTGEVGAQAGGDGPPFRLPGPLSAHSRKPLAPAAFITTSPRIKI